MSQKVIKKKKHHPVRSVFTFFLFALACFFTYTSFREVMILIQYQNEISQKQAEISELQEQQKLLEEEKSKFNDPEYVQRYARGKHLLSKEGETIYKWLPDTETSE